MMLFWGIIGGLEENIGAFAFTFDWKKKDSSLHRNVKRSSRDF